MFVKYNLVLTFLFLLEIISGGEGQRVEYYGGSFRTPQNNQPQFQKNSIRGPNNGASNGMSVSSPWGTISGASVDPITGVQSSGGSISTPWGTTSGGAVNAPWGVFSGGSVSTPWATLNGGASQAVVGGLAGNLNGAVSSPWGTGSGGSVSTPWGTASSGGSVSTPWGAATSGAGAGMVTTQWGSMNNNNNANNNANNNFNNNNNVINNAGNRGTIREKTISSNGSSWKWKRSPSGGLVKFV